MTAQTLLGIALSAFVLSTAPAQAATVFNYGPGNSYTNTTYVQFTRKATLGSSDGGTYTYVNAFSDTTPLLSGTSYTGPAFYGGYQFTSEKQTTGTGSFAFNQQVVQLDATSDRIQIQPYWAGTWGPTSTTGMIVFLQSDFNTGFESGQFTLDGLSMTSGGAPRRWVIKEGSQYYISNVSTTYAYSQSLTGVALQNTLWAPYNPAANLTFDTGSATFQTLSLTGITGVGFYWDLSQSSSTNSGFNMFVDSFMATGTAVPEPHSASLFLIPAGLLAASFARRRYSC